MTDGTVMGSLQATSEAEGPEHFTLMVPEDEQPDFYRSPALYMTRLLEKEGRKPNGLHIYFVPGLGAMPEFSGSLAAMGSVSHYKGSVYV